MSHPAFSDADEFRAVIDRVFTLMDQDPEIGPRLRAADVPQRFDFEDLGLVLNVRARRDGEDGNLCWAWSDDVDWDPRVRLCMASEIANRYFQGRENIAVAVARRRIKTGGDVKAALAVLPITQPVFVKYRAMLEEEYPHLVAL
jgi:hypothetical protein